MKLFKALAAFCFVLASYFALPVYADPACGDGIVEGIEQCDDNNMQNGDGCTNVCMVENDWSCVGSPSVCEFTSPCTAGNYWNGTACTGATAGHYVPDAGATEEKACATGSYQPNIQSTSCVLADAGYYVDTPAATAQAPCPEGMNSDVGASICHWPPLANYTDFVSGQPAVAADMNDRFTDLVNKVNQLQAQLDALQAYAGPRTTANLAGVYDLFEVSTDVDNNCPTCFSIAGTSSAGTVTFNADGTGVLSTLYQYRQLSFNMQNHLVGFPQPPGDNNNSGSMSVNAATVQLNNDPETENSLFNWSISGDVVTVETEDGPVNLIVAGRMMVFSEDPSEGHNGISVLVRR